MHKMTFEELFQTEYASTNYAYTRYYLSIGAIETLPKIVTLMLPCLWLYVEIDKKMNIDFGLYIKGKNLKKLFVILLLLFLEKSQALLFCKNISTITANIFFLTKKKNYRKFLMSDWDMSTSFGICRGIWKNGSTNDLILFRRKKLKIHFYLDLWI
jgi:hypothetical protein